MDKQDKLEKEVRDKLNSIIHDWYWKDDKLTETINELYPDQKGFLGLEIYETIPRTRRAFLAQLSAAVFRMEYVREAERIKHEKESL